MNSSFPLTRKDSNGPLRAVFIGRISTKLQKEEAIEASFAYDRRILAQLYDGDVDIEEFGEQGSGQLVNRTAIDAAKSAIATRTRDLVLLEDLSRAYRNPAELLKFVQFCIDHDTRVIAPGDNVDTADASWESAALLAAVRHGMFIPDTRRRGRRSPDHSFDNAAMVEKVRCGYRKLGKQGS